MNGRADVPLERLGVRILIGMSIGLATFFAAEFAADLARSPVPWSDLHATSRAGQALASCVSRAQNNLTVMVLTFIALAVPLTANMYTPKLIEIFVRDKLNIAAMCFYAAMGAHAQFAQAAMYDQWNPVILYHSLWISGVVGFTLLVPYYFYVLSFLNPVRIIQRVTERLVEEFDVDVAAAHPDADARRRVDQRILNLGNVILRAVDRADRDVSLHAISALERAIVHYVDVKPRLPAEWFATEPELFTGHSADAVSYVVKDRVWVEQKCLHQLFLAYSASLSKMPDAISAISSVNLRVALHARNVGDERLAALCVRYFNTFLREAVKRKDIHAIYDVNSQYHALARSFLAGDAATAAEIAKHCQYYAEFARWQGMPFIYELAAYDLVDLVDAAYESGSSARRDLLDRFLSFETDHASVRLVKAQALLAGALRERKLAAEATLVETAIARADVDLIEKARRELLATTDAVFWEVTDRQRNLDYVPPDRRAAVKQVLDDAARRKRDGLAAS